MRTYTDLTTIYPSKSLRFGKYGITVYNNKNYVDRSIQKFYGIEYDNSKIYKMVSLYKESEDSKYPFIVMSTSKLEQLIYQNFIDNATGDVLIFGLGLGFIIFPLLTDESITSITVIDNDVDIINTVSPIIEKYDVHNKLQVVEGDLYTYHQQIPNEKYDYIYFDIWSILTSDIAVEATALSLLYEKNKKTDSSVIDYCCSDLFGSKNSNKISNIRI
jgi:hypothetical protein